MQLARSTDGEPLRARDAFLPTSVETRLDDLLRPPAADALVPRRAGI